MRASCEGYVGKQVTIVEKLQKTNKKTRPDTWLGTVPTEKWGGKFRQSVEPVPGQRIGLEEQH